MTYDDALSLLNKANLNSEPLLHGQDLKRFHEQVLTDHFEGYPIFVTHFPSNLRPFYMKQKGDRALCFDLILPIGGEVAGGSLREDNYEILTQRIESMGQAENLKWYADLRRTGCSPHGGFGIGLDRILQSMLQIPNIRDAVPFPRWHHMLPL
jgi:asparaginyl-tRNA synthetase